MSERDAVELLLKQTEDLLVRTRRQIDALAAREDRSADVRERSDETFRDEFEPRSRF